jgi:hypothetical protein
MGQGRAGRRAGGQISLYGFGWVVGEYVVEDFLNLVSKALLFTILWYFDNVGESIVFVMVSMIPSISFHQTLRAILWELVSKANIYGPVTGKSQA